MRPGQGFVRRVTSSNLKDFARFLIPPGTKQRRGADDSGSGNEVDPQLEAAEALFAGNPITPRRVFRSSPRAVQPPERTREARPPERPPERRVIEVAAGLPEVLFAEIPRASDRWNQANFSKDIFDSFFRANTPGALTMSHVDDSAAVHGEPQRPGVSVRSRNFRLELAAAAGKKYPANGAPIGVFLPVGTKQFYYMLLMPGDPHYRSAREILNQYARAVRGRMKRVRIAGAVAMRNWQDSPLWIAYQRRPRANT